jgi:hypothetical protein
LALRICADRIIIIIERGADWVRKCKTNYFLGAASLYGIIYIRVVQFRVRSKVRVRELSRILFISDIYMVLAKPDHTTSVKPCAFE